MLTLVPAGAEKLHKARLLSSVRITPDASREEVRQLMFQTDDAAFAGKTGSCIRIIAPGQFGSRQHTRLYSLADHEPAGNGLKFAVCVRRCFYIDDFNGEKYAGVASNYLCDLKPDAEIEFSGPVGYPFAVPDDPHADLLMIGMGTGIAPFRGLVRLIYEKHRGWKGRVRLFHGARSGLEMLYLNDANDDLANYFDQPTFKAFEAVSPRPAFDAPVALGQALERNAAEVWDIINSPNCRVYLAGVSQMFDQIDAALTKIGGSGEAWRKRRSELAAGGRWVEVLY